MFDTNGRCRPVGLKSPAHATPRGYFVLTPPPYDYDAIHARLASAFGVEGLPDAACFRARAEAILAGLESRPEVNGILRGAHVPFMLPRAQHADIGEALDQRYLPVLRQSFQGALPEYAFVDHHATSLAKRLEIVSGSRHERLVEAMRRDAVVGWYFPCMSEYSVPAALERVAALPEDILLAGGYDTCAALTGTPSLLLRSDGYPPLLWLAALTGGDPIEGHYFEAYGFNLTFNRRKHFGQAAEYWNSALVVIG